MRLNISSLLFVWLPQNGTFCRFHEPSAAEILKDGEWFDLILSLAHICVFLAITICGIVQFCLTKKFVAFLLPTLSLLNTLGILVPRTHRVVQMSIFLILPGTLMDLVDEAISTSDEVLLKKQMFWKVLNFFCSWPSTKTMISFLEFLAIQSGYVRGVVLLFEHAAKLEGFTMPLPIFLINFVSTSSAMAAMNVFREISSKNRLLTAQIITFSSGFLYSATEFVALFSSSTFCCGVHSSFSYLMLIYRTIFALELYALSFLTVIRKCLEKVDKNRKRQQIHQI